MAVSGGTGHAGARVPSVDFGSMDAPPLAKPGWAEDLFFIPAAAAVLVMLLWALSRSTSAGFLQRYHRRAGTSLPADG